MAGGAAKRAVDFLGAALALLVTSPFLLVIAVAIRLDSPGPVFYRQTRVGRGGRRFECLKFRTMVCGADEILKDLLAEDPELRQQYGVYRKLRNDPRVTRVGRFLRRFSLDELPQIINVLQGHMSLVGPRPCLPDETELYGKDLEVCTRVRPGITGLWQVSGRNETAFEERVRLEVWYVENWSLRGDLDIILKTLGAVLGQRGAY